MKRSQLAILILLLVVLGAAAWLLARRNTTAWQSTTGHLPEKVLHLPINDVAQIVIQQPQAQVNLVKKGDGWVVAEKGNYPANFDFISLLIRNAWSLKPVQEVKVGQSQLGRLTLLSPGQGAESGTLIDFKDANGKRLAAILLGKKSMSEPNPSIASGRSLPVGRYVMPEDDSHRVMLVSEIFQQADNKPQQWLDRTFIKIEKPLSIAVTGATPDATWTLEHGADSKEWKLADAKPGEQLDAAKANQVASALNSVAAFTDVMPPDTKRESVGLDKPTTATITTEDGFTYVLNIGKKTDENYPLELKVSANLPSARPVGKDEKPGEKSKLDQEFQTKKETLEKKLATEKKFENRIYLVPKFWVEMLEKKRADLMVMASPTPGSGPVLSPSARPLASFSPPRPK